MDWVWEHSQSKGVARLVMLAIADKAYGRDCKAYAGLTALQQRANAGRSTVIGVVRELVASGELEIVEGESGRNGATVYRLPKALGHVRGKADVRGESVQKPNRSGETGASRIGADSAPIEELGGAGIGAETEPIASSGAPQTGAGTAPIDGKRANEIGADSAPIDARDAKRIGAESGPESVQILDGIGAVPAPQNQEQQLLNQEEIYISGASGAEGKPKRRRSRADDRMPVEPDAFAAFWSAYPKKDSKPAAIKAWNAALARGADPKTMITAAGAYARHPGRNPSYTKNPSTWLNNDCWDDDLTPASSNGFQPYLEDPEDDRPYTGNL